MRKNEYTKAVSEIKAPENSVNKMLETIRAYSEQGKTVSIKTFNYKAAAAVLVVFLAVGGTVVYNIFSKAQAPQNLPTTESAPESTPEKQEPQLPFTLKVSAEEITPDTAVIIKNNGYGDMYDEKTGTYHYDYDFDVSCEGENIKTVTYTIDHDKIGIITFRDENNVLYGTPAEGAEDIMLSFDTVPNDELAARIMLGEKNGDVLKQAFSSVTFDYNHQRAESFFTFKIFGKTDKDGGKIWEDLQNYTEDGANIRAEAMRKVIDNTIHCTVEFENGQTSTKDIKITSEVFPRFPDDPECEDFINEIVCREVTPE